VVFGLSEYFHIYYDEEKLFYKNNFITKESKEVLIWVCRSLGKESIKSILASSILYHGSSGYERTEMEDEKVDALVELGEKEDVVSPLIQLLDSEASKKMPSVSRVAVRVLGKIGGQQAFDSLFKFYLSSRWPSSDFLSYRSPSSDLQRLTIFALGKIDLKKALSLVNFEYERVKGAKVDNPHYIAIIWLQHIKTLFETGQYDIKEDWWIIDTLNEVSFKDELRYRLNM
jgi:hypothetical protein